MQEGFDKAILHLNYSNKRMLIALIIVCVTFVITITVFVIGYTIREKNWLDTVLTMKTPVVEVTNGTQSNADP